jgi:thiamine monophosphate kinase
VKVEIDADKIPTMSGISPLEALSSGEEYEIVVTAPHIDVNQFSEEFGLRLTEIGRVVAGSPGVEILQSGERISTPQGFDHFREK